ncbi:GNVR domain-containing protein [Klebsiella pneumoniae]|uniref:GNVR domain-containing protein n=1 Tax=Klebsiella pneumoniae TaxID=573 RepID=UPI003A4DDDB2
MLSQVELYICNLLNRQQELNIAKSSAIGNVRIIDSAVTQHKPVKPNKIIVVLAGLFIGLVISVSLVLVRILLRKELKLQNNWRSWE